MEPEVWGAVVASLPAQAVAVMDCSGTITAWNEAAADMTGVAATDALGRSVCWLRGLPHDQAAASALLQAAERSPLVEASWRQRADGGRYWCEATLFAVRDAAGRTIAFAEHFLAAAVPVAARGALGSGSGPVSATSGFERGFRYRQDLELRYTDYDWVGTSPPVQGDPSIDDLLGRTHQELFPPATADAATALKLHVIREGKPATFHSTTEIDGLARHFQVSVEPLWDSEGNVAGVEGTVIDVTDMKRAEEEARRTSVLLAEAEKVARMGSWVWDLPQNSVVWSDGLLAIFGITRDQAPTSYPPPGDISFIDDRGRFVAAVAEAAETGEDFEITYRIVRTDGHIRQLHARTEILADPTGKPIRMTGTVQDVTEVRAIEDALQDTVAELNRRANDLQRLTHPQPAAQNHLHEHLSPRQHEILALLAEGLSNGEIATRLYLTENTIKWHVRKILRTLGVSNRAQAVAHHLKHSN